MSQPESQSGEWLLMVDGAARGNPGEAGCGALIVDDRGVVRRRLCRYLGVTTNNVAEYEGLIMGLEALLELNAKRVRIQSDSELMVRQLNGVYRVRDEKLKKLHQKAQRLLRLLDGYRIIHVAREENRAADRLANRGVEHGPGKAPRLKRLG
jgi:ribonuclease HI